MTAQRAALVLVGAVIAAGLALLLTRDEVRLAGTNGVAADTVLARTGASGLRHCQDGELLPAGTAALVLSLRSGSHGGGPPVLVAATAGAEQAGGVLVARADAGWRGSTVRARFDAPLQEDTLARICVDVGPRVALLGAEQPDGSGRLRIEAWRERPESWWALAPVVAQRIGFVHPWGGRAVAVLAALLTLAAGTLALWLCTRERA